MTVQSIERQKKLVKDKGLEKIVQTKPCVIVAEGAATGHAHAFYEPEKVEFDQPTGKLTIKAQAGLDHDEHATHIFQPGTADVDIQREYSMGSLRRVAD